MDICMDVRLVGISPFTTSTKKEKPHSSCKCPPLIPKLVLDSSTPQYRVVPEPVEKESNISAPEPVKKASNISETLASNKSGCTASFCHGVCFQDQALLHYIWRIFKL
jgi:hypothetical protein